MNNTARIKHIFEFMNYDALSEAQEDYVISFEEQFIERGQLSERQMEILEDIFRRAATGPKREF